jgi:hypothetical protein
MVRANMDGAYAEESQNGVPTPADIRPPRHDQLGRHHIMDALPGGHSSLAVFKPSTVAYVDLPRYLLHSADQLGHLGSANIPISQIGPMP